MTGRESLNELLECHREDIIKMIRKNELGMVIRILDRLCGGFKLPATEYDRSRCTPYTNEVTTTYGLTEYVNASFIQTEGTLFVAAQNPKEEKKELFLDLLERSGTELVISLINDSAYFEEKWLLERNIVQHCGKDLFVDEIYSVRGRNIRRLRYIDWKDFSVVPQEEMECFHTHFNCIRTPTILVHCIAGVGRTGTFIMYDILRRTENPNIEQFVDTLLHLRGRRAHLVTNDTQLRFLRDVFISNTK